MATSVARVLISAVVIGLVTSLAKRHTLLAGWIAALPLVTLLSIAWLMPDRQNHGQITRLVASVLAGMIPTALLLGATWMGLRKGLPVAAALAIGAAVWGVYTWAWFRLS